MLSTQGGKWKWNRTNRVRVAPLACPRQRDGYHLAAQRGA